jgi:hypothetical protein
MGSGGEELGDASSLEACLRETESSSESSAASTDDNGVVFVINHSVFANSALTLNEKKRLLYGSKWRKGLKSPNVWPQIA